MQVTTLEDFGEGSLREVLKNANKVPTQNEKNETNMFGMPNPFVFINFTVEGTIILSHDLPPLFRKCIGIIGNNKIEIDCNGNNGIKVEGNNCYIKGISITNSKNYGIELYSESNFIDNCKIGITNDNILKPNLIGIYMDNSNNNRIGENNDNDQNYFSNVISGNIKNGITMINSNNNKLYNNIIGLNSDGTLEIPNGKNGIYMLNCKNIQIGGDIFQDNEGNINNPTGDKGKNPGTFVRPLLGNVISGNIKNGILIENCKDVTLNGNFIGVDKTGCNSIGNYDGVNIQRSKYVSLIGCKIFNNPFVYYNVISGNKNFGIHINNSLLTTIQGNFIGTNSNNNACLPNKYGVVVSGISSYITFGGRIPLGNVVAGNLNNGILLCDNTSNFMSFNTFCGLFAFGNIAPNGKSGIFIKDNSNNHDLRTNVISGNKNHGIEITDNCHSIQIVCNIIGLDTSGKEKYPNEMDGINISGKANNISIINDSVPSVIPRNTISGNLEYGIMLTQKSNNITISGTIVGFDVSGTDQISNGKSAIFVDCNSCNNKIGSIYDRNYITAKEKPAIIICGKYNTTTQNSINTNVLLMPVQLLNENYVDISNNETNSYYANDEA